MADRNTKIDADQIADHSLGPNELDTENLVEDFTEDIVLTFNSDTEKLKYVTPSEIVNSEGAIVKQFEYDGNGDINPITKAIFVPDGNGDLCPSADGTEDDFFEIIADEIVPKL